MKSYPVPFAARMWCVLLGLLLASACSTRPKTLELADFEPVGLQQEQVRVMQLHPNARATIVAPPREKLRADRPVELVIYALPNGNTTEQTIGKATPAGSGIDWHFDIQHIGAQTRELRARGMNQVIVAYLEADPRSWPQWRKNLGYDAANPRIVKIVDELREAIGNPDKLTVTLTGHSGGGGFVFGFIEGVSSIPDWVDRIAFLDSNYNFDAAQHAAKFTDWIKRDPRHYLVVLAYDDREITLNGKKVVGDTGGTYRASHRMVDAFGPEFHFTESRLGDFEHFASPQFDILIHTNPENKILHTVLVGDLNGFMHAMLYGSRGYAPEKILVPSRLYTRWIENDLTLPLPSSPAIPPRAPGALSGTAFIEKIADLQRDEREALILKELLAGNIPDFLRQWKPVTVKASDSSDIEHTATYMVMPDYLSIGSNEDFVRMPMNPYTAQAFCDAFGLAMTTRKMCDDIWQAAAVKLDPKPMTEARESSRTYLAQNNLIEEQRKGAALGELVAGIKKDVVMTNRIQERPNRVAIYGWHYKNGQPIQPLTTVHVDWYVDYSHGIRCVQRMIEVDGRKMSYEDILKSPQLHVLLSDEGEIPVARYAKKQ